MALHLVDWREAAPGNCRGGAVAIGNFDGVHRGHASLMMTLRGRGRPCADPPWRSLSIRILSNCCGPARRNRR